MRNSKLFKITLTAAAALTFAGFAESSAKADTQADIDAITQKIKDTEKSIKEGQEKLSKLEDLQYQKTMEIDGLKKNIKARKAQLARQARAAQVNNAGSMIDFVSKSRSLSEAIGRTFTVATLVHANNEAVAQQKADQEKVAADKAVVDKAAADQAQANKNFNNDLAQLAVQKTQLEVKKAKEDEAARKAAQEAEKKAREAAEKVANAKNERDAQNALNDANNAVASVTKSDNNNNNNNNNNVAAQASTQQTSNTSAAPAAKYGSVVGYALSFQGVPYVYGGTSPSGFDCSGLVQYVFAAFGKQLPRTAGAQKAVCTPISESQLQPGDLVFWGTGHVGIYIGGGNFVHAPTTGDHVKVTSMNYYHPDSYGRVN
ncbi:C40 family peptidase [Ligilactobacillus ruminis]|jgi:cell wall-associated NlpC family hydrolase|uniref:NlpC P60 n=2 Tax=Ligilactobacillus ruminis TaxID=1623 RepID=A0A837IUP4_9LACO|nr:NlpC/P60 family protein [Ligilactobacillus ruminis]KLA45926.1 NlpC P60 [Ligilactobacillus ruminis]KRM82276.1 NlpC P60 [Ligilactobacillus ruminis DSM 20403 = NBRC 102161]MCR5749294.1 C40 family peptidase [Lactobacillus sp.]SFG36707.1 Cell wall-associated hydrolase, NlpC family [Ligilactobacillus ruminis DSM 20403 = NBRC 102161]